MRFVSSVMSSFVRRLGSVIGIPALGAITLMLSGCSGVGLLNFLTPDSAYQRTTDIAYGSDARNKLDVYVPVKPLPDTPVVLFIYGGSWNSGNKNDYRFVGQALAKRGVLAVIADYRVYPQVTYPSFIDDTAAALAWTYHHAADYGGDVRHLYIMGHSSGAYNAAMVALDPRWLAAYHLTPSILSGWIGLAGPYDFLPIQVPQVKIIFHSPDTPRDSQPVEHISASAPPALLIASRSDTYVDPHQNTDSMADRLRAAGVPVEVRYFEHTSHLTLIGALAWPLRPVGAVGDTIGNFILRNDRNSAVAGDAPNHK